MRTMSSSWTLRQVWTTRLAMLSSSKRVIG